jgi:hypothetical protein
MNAHIVSLCCSCLLLVAGPSGAALGDHFWSAGYDIYAVSTLDGTGHVASSGTLFGTIDFGGGPLSTVNSDGAVIVVRHDGNGNYLWGQLFEPTGYVTVDRIAADEAGHIVIVGTIYGSGGGKRQASIDFGGGPIFGDNEFYVAGFDAAGNHLFSRVVGPGFPQDVFARGGKVAVTGYTYSSIDFGGGAIGGAGGADAFLGCLTTTGAHVWSAAFGDAADQGGMAVALDTAGQVHLAVTTTSAIDFGGGVLTPTGSVGLCLVQFTDAGGEVWSEIFDGQFSGGAGILATLDLDVSSSGRVALGGQMNGSCDFGGGPLTSNGSGDAFVASFDGFGSHEWSSNHGGTVTDAVTGVAFDASGNVVCAGHFSSTSIDFGNGALIAGPNRPNPFVAVIDAAGVSVFSNAFPTGAYAFSVDVSTAPGRIFLTGTSQSGLDLGGGPLGSATLFHGMFEGTPGTSTAAPPILTARLEQNHPNPFNPSTTIRYHLAHEGAVEILVTDLAGRRVATLWRGIAQAGANEVHWSGRDDAGRPVAGGVYVYRLRTDEGTWLRRMALAK